MEMLTNADKMKGWYSYAAGRNANWLIIFENLELSISSL